MVSLELRGINGPNVNPLSILALNTGSSLVWFSSHYVTIISSPSVAAISALIESMLVVLLRLILSPNVAPLSVEALNITSELLLGMCLSVVHTIYLFTLMLPEVWRFHHLQAFIQSRMACADNVARG